MNCEGCRNEKRDHSEGPWFLRWKSGRPWNFLLTCKGVNALSHKEEGEENDFTGGGKKWVGHKNKGDNVQRHGRVSVC